MIFDERCLNECEIEMIISFNDSNDECDEDEECDDEIRLQLPYML